MNSFGGLLDHWRLNAGMSSGFRLVTSPMADGARGHRRLDHLDIVDVVRGAVVYTLLDDLGAFVLKRVKATEVPGHVVPVPGD